MMAETRAGGKKTRRAQEFALPCRYRARARWTEPETASPRSHVVQAFLARIHHRIRRSWHPTGNQLCRQLDAPLVRHCSHFRSW